MAVEIAFHVTGTDEHQVDAVAAHLAESFLAAGAEVTSRQPGEVDVVIANMPVQLGLEDAVRLRTILRTLEEYSPALAQEGLEIIEPAILLR